MVEALGSWGNVVDGLQREEWMQDQDVQLCLELSYSRNQFLPIAVLNTDGASISEGAKGLLSLLTA